MLPISTTALTHPGRKRSNNEDAVRYLIPASQAALRASGSIFVVADGVGGASKGEWASSYATERVIEEYYQQPETDPEERLRSVLRQIGNEIFDQAERSRTYRRMATTMVAAVIRGDQLIVANVGDSRAYLIREGKVWQITRDHTEVAELIEDGLLAESEAQNLKVKNPLTRSLGGEQDVLVDVYPAFNLLPGDRVLLCTDGLTRYAQPQDIAVLAGQGSLQDCAQKAIDYANESGGVDNISVILIGIGEAAESESTEAIPTLLKAGAAESDQDLLDTIPGDRRPRRKTSTPPPRSTVTVIEQLRPYSAAIIAGLVLACLAAVFGIFIGRGGFGAVSPLLLSPIASVMEQTDAADEKIASPTRAATPAPPFVPTQTEANGDLILCVIEIQQNDTLEGILSYFRIRVDSGNRYYEYRTCAEEEGGVRCSNRQRIDPDLIHAGFWLEIPERQSRQVCEARAGKVLIEE